MCSALVATSISPTTLKHDTFASLSMRTRADGMRRIENWRHDRQHCMHNAHTQNTMASASMTSTHNLCAHFEHLDRCDCLFANAQCTRVRAHSRWRERERRFCICDYIRFSRTHSILFIGRCCCRRTAFMLRHRGKTEGKWHR